LLPPAIQSMPLPPFRAAVTPFSIDLSVDFPWGQSLRHAVVFVATAMLSGGL
jgi:hypothetical protein